MNSARKNSLAAGVFYLLTFVSIPTLALYHSVRSPDFIVGPGPDGSVITSLSFGRETIGWYESRRRFPVQGVFAREARGYERAGADREGSAVFARDSCDVGGAPDVSDASRLSFSNFASTSVRSGASAESAPAHAATNRS